LFDVHIEDPHHEVVKADVVDNGDGTWTVNYQPTEPGKYHIDVIQRNPSVPLLYDHVKNSPIDIEIDPGTVAAQTIAYGPGLEPGNLDTEAAQFTIEARDKNGNKMKEGGDPFVVEVQGPTGPIPVEVVDNGDGTYNVTYNPDDAGRHDIAVTLDGKPIKGSTFKVEVKPGAWAGKSTMEFFYFDVKSQDKRGRPLTTGGAKIKVQVKKPDGQQCQESSVQDLNNGSYTIKYKAAEPGQYHVSVTIDGREIAGSPFTQNIS